MACYKQLISRKFDSLICSNPIYRVWDAFDRHVSAMAELFIAFTKMKIVFHNECLAFRPEHNTSNESVPFIYTV